MDYHCEVIERAAQPTLSVRFRCPVQDLSQHLGRVYGAIGQYLGQLGEHPGGAPFAAYYNMDMHDLDVEAGFPVAHPLPGKGDIQVGEIPAGRAATCTYVGPYDEIASAWDGLARWMSANGYEAAGPAYEMYLNDPAEVAPQYLMTQLWLPLKG